MGHIYKVIENFLGNRNIPKLPLNCKLIIAFVQTNVMQYVLEYSFIGFTLKFFFFYNLGTVRDEHGERYHQQITLIESTSNSEVQKC